MKTVLIVEDSEGGRDMYADALEEAGYAVLQAADGAEAVRLATADQAPDLVLMNLSIPIVPGVDAIEILKGHPTTQDVPVLVVSGHTSHDLREGAWTAGCDDFLAKPLAPSKLIEAVKDCIGGP